MILYEDQDTNLWNKELIQKGEYYLNLASRGNQLSKYHVEAAIGYWHTQKWIRRKNGKVFYNCTISYYKLNIRP
jgi:predicted RNA polymerase sigma factor